MDTNEFLWMFTGAELRAINTATETDDDVYKMWQVMTNTNNGVNLDNSDMQAGLALLVYTGLLTQARYDELLLGRIL
jgi:hypothetical protein